MPPTADPQTNVRIKVRAQARGGKFLGPGVEAPTLLVRKAGDTNPLFTGTFDNSSSGTIVATPGPTSTRNSVVVQPSPAAQPYPAAGTYFLDPPGNESQAMIIASFDLTAPTLVEFVATAYTKNPKNALVSSTMTLQLNPGTVFLDDPGLVLLMPGLIVSDIAASRSGATINVSATVTMMCGCPITPQPWATSPPDTEPYWPSYEFAVTANIPGVPPFPLQCTGVSTFAGSVQATIASGTYAVTVVAEQPAEANSGFAIAMVQL